MAKEGSVEQKSERIYNIRRRMNANSFVSTVSFIGFFTVHYFISSEKFSNIASALCLFLWLGAIFYLFRIVCEYCGSGWYEFPDIGIKEFWTRRKNKKDLKFMRFDPLNVPDNCPVCQAKFK